MTSECPNPHKRAFTTRAEIDAERERLRIKQGVALRAYRCGCGALHLTSRVNSAATVAKHLDWLHVTRFTEGLVLHE